MVRLIVILVIVFAITSSVLGGYTNITASMDDTLFVGESFLVLKFWYGLRIPFTSIKLSNGFIPHNNDIVVFIDPIDPQQVHVKRCVAVGGQSVEIIQKKLFVNDVEVPLPPKGKNADPTIIPAGQYGSGKRDFIPKTAIPDSAIYVLGDNRDFSFDSRIWKFLSKKNLLGKAWIIVWSINPDVPWTDITHKVRWNKMFQPVK